MRRVQRVVRLAKKYRWVPTGYYLDWWVSVTGYVYMVALGLVSC